ncbi:cathepsin B [Acrasis kona]|uniref:Cathepsin B n=1 Tax=Acrasis kona TaxID=1008807 RepID=A0AAW2YMG1_9EUKA
MKTAVFCLLAIVAFVAAGNDYFSQPAIHRDLIEEINQDPTSTWTAGFNKNFANMSLKDVKHKLLGARSINLIPGNHPAKQGKYAVMDVPAEFDSRKQWPNCIHKIRNQEKCGSCWAFAASEVLSDRFCIASEGKTDVVLSPQYLVACDTGDYGCQGGYLANSWQFLEDTGLPSDECTPYTAGGGVEGECPSTCKDGSALKFYKASDYVTPSTPEDMQKEILTNGPVEVAFSVYRDFLQYKGGVYAHKTGGLLGGHAVKCIGWGVEDGTPYWIIANSWGEEWGENGTFKIKRGSNECGIESNVITGTPAL